MTIDIPYFGELVTQAPSAAAWVALVIAVLLLGVSGMISASEVAFFSLSPQDLQCLDNEEHPSDPDIKRLISRSDRLMASILIGNNFVNVAIITLFMLFFESLWVKISLALDFIIQSVLLTFLLLLFGEIMPKIFASRDSLKFSRRVAPFVSAMESLLRPFTALLVNSMGHINRRLADHVGAEEVSSEDLGNALSITPQVNKEEKKMLEGIISFGDKSVKDVMTSRMDMTALEEKTSFHQVLQLVNETKYSRIPVYRETEDYIQGILYVKDLLPFLQRGNDFRWQTLVREAYFVPENKMIDDLLNDFRKKRLHMAIVVDEFGGTAGLITMEDVLEEIVGEIHDEYDEDKKTWRKVGQNEWIMEGKTSLSDFYKATELDSDYFDDKTDNCESVAGLLMEIKQDFLHQGETIHFKRLDFMVQNVDKRHVESVRVKYHGDER